MASAAKTRRLKRMKTEMGIGGGTPSPGGETLSEDEADRLADAYRPSWETEDPDEESGVSAVNAPVAAAGPPVQPLEAPVIVEAPEPPAAAAPPARLVSSKATLPLGTAAPSDTELRAALAATAPGGLHEPAASVVVSSVVVSPPAPPSAARPAAVAALPPGHVRLPALERPDRDPLDDTGRLRAAKAGGGIRGSVIIAASAIIALGIVVSTYLITRRGDSPAATPQDETANVTAGGATPSPTPTAGGTTAPAAPAGEPEGSSPEVTPTTTAAVQPAAEPAAPEPAPSAEPAPPPAPPEPPMARVRISSVPAGAALTLDGVTVVNPYEARIPRDGREHQLAATLDGYDPATRTVSFDRDEITVRLSLRRVAPPPAPVVERPSPVARPARTAAVSRPVRAPSGPRPRPAPPPRRPTKRGAGFVTTNPY